MQDRKVAIWAFIAGKLDRSLAGFKEPSASSGSLADDPYALGIATQQKAWGARRRKLARQGNAGHKVNRHDDLLANPSIPARWSSPRRDSRRAILLWHRQEINRGRLYIWNDGAAPEERAGLRLSSSRSQFQPGYGDRRDHSCRPRLHGECAGGWE